MALTVADLTYAFLDVPPATFTANIDRALALLRERRGPRPSARTSKQELSTLRRHDQGSAVARNGQPLVCC
jgi:hypothetical protein